MLSSWSQVFAAMSSRNTTYTLPVDCTPASGFGCELMDDLTYAIRVYDETGAVSDCALWGHDPAAIIGGRADYSEVNETGELLACDVWN